MALATRCPHCHTTFRVAHDQLKLRAGLVRCGACKEIFNGIEHLLPQAAPAPASAPLAIPPAPTPAPAAPPASAPSALPTTPVEPPPLEQAQAKSGTAETAAPDVSARQDPEAAVTQDDDAPPEAPTEQVAPHSKQDLKPVSEEESDIPDFFDLLKLEEAARGDEPHQAASLDDDPLTRMTLMDFHDREVAEGEQHAMAENIAQGEQATDNFDPLEQTIDELQSRPDRRKARLRRPRNMQKPAEHEANDELDAVEDAEDIEHVEEIEVPSFVKKARRRERFGPIVTWTLAIGSVLLTLTLLGQAIYTFRNQLAARLPKAKPLLIQACTYVDCRINLPMQIEMISIEANELQTTSVDKEVLVLTTILRNRSSLTQAWPNLELTLKDADGKPLVRRVFLPREYLLDPKDVDRGFASSTEQQIKLTFNLAQPESSGYEVAVFYP